MAKLRVKNLRLRTRIGINEWEQQKKQEVVINVELNYDSAKAIETDQMTFAVDYKKLKHEIMDFVEPAQISLIEKLADGILSIVLTYKYVTWAKVQVDKPGALRFAESVSAEVEGDNG